MDCNSKEFVLYFAEVQVEKGTYPQACVRRRKEQSAAIRQGKTKSTPMKKKKKNNYIAKERMTSVFVN